MRRKKPTRIRRPCKLDEMPGNLPGAHISNVYIQRFDGETVSALLEGVVECAYEITRHDGLGAHEAGAEIRLSDGTVLEAVGFGPAKAELRQGAEEFTRRTNRLLVVWTKDGKLSLFGGREIDSAVDLFYCWP
jgi:hypothetical protein